MTIVRHYRMTAQVGKEDKLSEALNDLAENIRILAGCQGVDIMRSLINGRNFNLLEHWNSIEEHKNSHGKLPKKLVSAVMSLTDGDVEADYKSIN